MSNQLLTDPQALRMFFTDPVYLPVNKPVPVSEAPVVERIAVAELKQEAGTPYSFTYIGNNEKKILIIVNDEQYPVSTPGGAALLKNILRHLQLTIADFAMVNYHKNSGATFAQMQEFFNCRIAMVFGLNCADLSIDKEDTAQTFMHNNTRLLFGANLKEMESSNEAKKVFLNALNSVEKW